METASLGGSGAVQKLFQSAIPIGNPSSGSIANNGALSGLTPLLLTYSDLYLWFAANAIAAGVAAGFYYCQMSSTTAGTIFNNTYVSGVPVIPASPTPFVTTGPGAFAGVTGALNGFQFTIPGNILGPNGRLRLSTLFSNNNSAGTKSAVGTFGGQTFLSSADTTQQTQWILREIMNRGGAAKQVTQGNAFIGPAGSNSGPTAFTIDTTAAVTLGLNFNNNTATDWAIYDYFSAEVIPG